MPDMKDVHDLSSEPETKSEPSPSEKRPTKGRAIVTYGRSLISLVIARSLHEQGIEVIGCDDVGMTVLSFSRHVSHNFVHPSLEEDREEALEALEEAVRKYAPEDEDTPYVLIPAFKDARIFAEERDRFEPLIKIAAPDLSSMDFIDPKDQFAKFVEDHDLSAPKCQIIRPDARSDFTESEIDFPLIAKPSDGVGGRGVEKLDSADELKTYLDHAPKKDTIILQDLVDGRDYCVSVIADHGELAGIVAYVNERQFPIKSGAGAVRKTVDPEPFLETTRDLLRETRWNGVCEIDYRWDENGDFKPKLIEVNARYWAGLFHSTASGVDFPWLHYRLATGETLPPADLSVVDTEFRSRTPAAWILSIVEDIASSDEHLKKSSSAWKEMKDRASKGDLLRAANQLLKSAGHGMASPKMLTRLQEELKEHDDLPSEFTADKDPAVGLGILFAISSLQRHGELPPELKFDPKEDEDEDEAPVQKHRKPGRPVIGITKPDNGDWLAYQAMKFAVWLAGGDPVKITSKAPRDPKSIDGLLFGGGSDVYPERYQGAVKEGHRYNLARDEMEASWAEVALNQDIPVLGICRGMQMLNVLQGGTLYPDLSDFEDSDYPTSFLHRMFYRKPIRIEPDSWLAETVGTDELCVNSIHTQAVKDLGDSFDVAARELNGIIQSIEHRTARFMVGIQFHPEFLVYRKSARRIFERFISCAREVAQEHENG